MFKKKAPAGMSPQEVEEDVDDTVAALKTIVSLVATSSAFRLILSDALIVSRELIADTAAKVATAAASVENRATEVDEAVRPPPDASGLEGVDTLDVDAVQNKGKEVVKEAEDGIASGVETSANLVPESSERIKAAIVDRIKSVGFISVKDGGPGS